MLAYRCLHAARAPVRRRRRARAQTEALSHCAGRQTAFVTPANPVKRSPAASHCGGGGGGGSCQKPGKTPAPGRPAVGKAGKGSEKAQPAEPSRPGPTIGAGDNVKGCAWGAGPRLKMSADTAAAAAESQDRRGAMEPSAALPAAPGQPPPASIGSSRLPLARPSKGPADTAGG